MNEHEVFDRRDFLAKLTALGVATVIGGGERGSDLATSAFAESSATLGRLTAADFARFVGQKFRIEGRAGDWLDAELISVEPRRVSGRAPAGSRQPFSVGFRTYGAEPLPHQTYPVEHAELGRFPLFLGAVGKPGGRVNLEAVFG